VILEGIVTTLDAAGTLNVAPMGPTVEPGFQRFVLRPFRSSNTYRNLKFRGEGVLHVIDDVLLLARSTIGDVTDASTRPADRVRGSVLLESCRYYEFRVTDFDDRDDRATLHSETVQQGWFRDFFGFNRARHAVLETAILASRADFLPIEKLTSELEMHRVVVAKTGDRREAEAFELLEDHIKAVARRRGLHAGIVGS
jgi:hypothetical protein